MAPLAVLCLWGCDSFTPRKAPPPCEPATESDCPIPDSLISTVCQLPPEFVDPIIPEIVRDNVVRTLEGRSVSCLPSQPVVQPNYERSLAPGVGAAPEDLFTYVPDPGAEAQAPPGFFLGWRKEKEVQFMLKALEEVRNLLTVELDFLLFEKDLTFPETPNRTRYNIEYVLALTYGDSIPERTDSYAGRGTWDLVGGNRNFWTILTWEDKFPIEVPGQTIVGTMGTLRALVGP